jgi:hypothetical protein
MNSLWVDLGIRFEGGEIRFDESARFAATRRTITGDSAEATEDFLHRRVCDGMILAARVKCSPGACRYKSSCP